MCCGWQGILVYNMLYVSRYAEHVHVETQAYYPCIAVHIPIHIPIYIPTCTYTLWIAILLELNSTVFIFCDSLCVRF